MAFQKFSEKKVSEVGFLWTAYTAYLSMSLTFILALFKGGLARYVSLILIVADCSELFAPRPNSQWRWPVMSFFTSISLTLMPPPLLFTGQFSRPIKRSRAFELETLFAFFSIVALDSGWLTLAQRANGCRLSLKHSDNRYETIGDR